MNNKLGLADDAIICRSEDLLMAEVDGELMAMSIDRGICFGLDPIGTRIWTLLAEPCTLADLCAQLVSEYEVEAARCRSEVVDLIEELRAEGLATVQLA